MSVEYRFLQVVLSHLADDRVTVGLLHWDGQQMRVARSLSALKCIPEEHRDNLRRTINAKLKRAEKVNARIDGHRSLFSLGHIFPVRNGLGSTLYWSPVHVDYTGNAEAHFNEIKDLVHIGSSEVGADAAITNKKLASRLQMAAVRLHAESPGRVKIGETVKRLQSYTVPVSWKNGRWHHALPISLDGLSNKDMARRVRDLVGVIQLCIPLEDVPVPVAVLPSEPVRMRIAREEVRFVEECFPERGVQVAEALHDDDDVEMEPVLNRIRADIAT